LDEKIPRKNWVMIPYSKVYIDYKRWKDIGAGWDKPDSMIPEGYILIEEGYLRW